jgi:hypothetical protein
MKDRIRRAKQYLVDHQNDIVVGAAAISLGVTVGYKLSPKDTILTATPDELRTLLDNDNWSMSYKIAKQHTVHLIKIPSRSS